MPENPVKKQLNNAKKTACNILIKAGYKIERASNDIFCIIAMRGTEWRAIKVGVKPMITYPWFIEEVKKLERLPCPDQEKIKKELWIRAIGEHEFSRYSYENKQWYDEDFNPINIFN